MSVKSVLVHSCFFASTPQSIGTGRFSSKQIFHENPNNPAAHCACLEKITFHERDDRLASGEIYVICKHSELDANSLVPEWLEVVTLGKQTRIPHAESISDKNIRDAYVGTVSGGPSKYQQDRINEYGYLNNEAGEASWTDEVRAKVAAALSLHSAVPQIAN